MNAMAGKIALACARGAALTLVCAALSVSCDPGPEAASGAGATESHAPRSSVFGLLGPAKASPDQPIDPALTGGLTGRVLLAGPAPPPKPLIMAGDSYCVGVAKQSGALLDESLRVRDGAVAGAFVWVSGGLDGWVIPEPSGVVSLDQQGCLYHPRVLGLQTRQTLRVLNSDGVLHNVHTRPKLNRGRNLAMPGEVLQRDLSFKRAEVMIEVGCDVHAWMKGFIGVVDHSFFCVTDETGRWTLGGLPPGTYELEIWHERLGTHTVNASVSVGEQTDTGELQLSL